MIPLAEATDYVLSRCRPLEPTSVPVDEALQLVTTSEVVATGPIPPFDNTAMDGFAVRAGDVADAPVTLELLGTIAAGAAPSLVVGPGQAVRIMTGAPIPEGADAVVMVEWTQPTPDDSGVLIERPVPTGNHIRPAGDDVASGDVVFEVGTRLGAAHLGVCTSLGVYEVAVHRRPRIGVISTGDELVDRPGPLEVGQIRDSNRHTLLALLESTGATGVDLGLIADDESEIRRALVGAAAECDAVITSGGVSMGDFDYVKSVLDDIGDMRWMQVAIKPAKPLAFGTVDGVPVFGLPGNPVSSMVSFELFARPGINALMGSSDPEPRTIGGVAGIGLPRRPDGKTHFARVTAEPDPQGILTVRRAGGQGSHQLSAMAAANALAIIPDGDGLSEGDPVELLLL